MVSFCCACSHALVPAQAQRKSMARLACASLQTNVGQHLLIPAAALEDATLVKFSALAQQVMVGCWIGVPAGPVLEAHSRLEWRQEVGSSRCKIALRLAV